MTECVSVVKYLPVKRQVGAAEPIYEENTEEPGGRLGKTEQQPEEQLWS